MEKQLILFLWAYILPLNVVRLIGHFFIHYFRKLGLVSLFLYLLFWIFCFFMVFSNSRLFLTGSVFIPNILLQIIGAIFFLLGLILQILTIKLMGLKTLLGIPEIVPAQYRAQLVVKGPFSLVRHPIYLGQLLCILGTFLFTSELSLAILFFIVSILFWPVAILEERELIERFGEEYLAYRKRVPMIFSTFKLQKKL